jgi:putative ABC transport system permease protein
MLFDALVVGNLRQNPTRFLINVFAIAVGVAFALAIMLSAQAFSRALEAALMSVGDGVTLQVFGGPRGIQERYLGEIRYARAVASANPIIDRAATMYDLHRSRETVRIVGVDSLRPLPGIPRLPEVFPGPYNPVGEPFDPSQLMFAKGAIVPARLAKRLNLHMGDKFDVVAGARKSRMNVTYIIPEGAHGVDSSVVFCDISTAQAIFGDPGYYDRIDVVPNGNTESARARLLMALPSYFRVERVGNELTVFSKLLRSFQSELAWLAIAGAISSSLVVATTMSASLIARRREIGIVRALGATSWAAFNALMQESILAGVIGSLLGVLFGEVLTSVLIRQTDDPPGACIFGATNHGPIPSSPPRRNYEIAPSPLGRVTDRP